MTNASFIPQDVIRKKRDNHPLSDGDIERFVDAITDDSLTDAQISAFAMAVFFNGMADGECRSLTHAMAHSGTVLDWKAMGLDAPTVDKHSTGGVGDKVSLMLAPMAAAAGAYVPMISGRGLGHTGGTLDKLDSIQGYNATPGLDHFARVVKDVGCAIIGQTADLAPADRRFYAVRDVTATVESIPLITASILSKKLAAGLNALTMDVKVGSGAFMDDPKKAKALAQNLINVAGRAGLPVTALITDMNQVLGHTAGNALEITETVDFLKGTNQCPRLRDVTVQLVASMLKGCGVSTSMEDGAKRARDVLDSGQALEVFAKMVAAMGGPTDFCEKSGQYLDHAPITIAVHAKESGVIERMDVRGIGMAVVALGGGRTRADQAIDPSVGLSQIKGIGDHVDSDTPICLIHARDENSAQDAMRRVVDAVTLGDQTPDRNSVVIETLS